jgi:glyoxylate/hydroxypyruvate reductase A
MTILLNISDSERLDAFSEVLGRALPDQKVAIAGMPYDPTKVRFLFTWQPLEDWGVLPNLEVVFSVSAGVDQFGSLPDHIALVKMVDPNITQGVADYVLSACLACLHNFPQYGDHQRQRLWEPHATRSVGDTHVVILGLGEIGQEAARKLSSIGFSVSGWSRSPRRIDGINCVAGSAAYHAIVQTADIIVCLLPLTVQTRGILSRPLFEAMKAGASLVHVGRGAHCVFSDLAAALESGHLSNAVVDVFETEPVPENDLVWDLKNCLMTPHVAGRTDALTAAKNVAANLVRLKHGDDLLWQVDRFQGY